ncbi:MAG TPA: Holliday junction resolvase RuvX, partial [Burkholderiaceae bacterium]|nr:Holliday junction resolvase RuvX [Burkholderiaceae bacterium]
MDVVITGRACVMLHEEIAMEENNSSVLTAAIPANLQSFIAFDFGLKRTGVAVGNRITDSAQGLATLKAEGNERWPLIEARIKEWQPDAIV